MATVFTHQLYNGRIVLHQCTEYPKIRSQKKGPETPNREYFHIQTLAMNPLIKSQGGRRSMSTSADDRFPEKIEDAYILGTVEAVSL